MKKIYNYLFLGIVGMLCMTLSSCNTDDYDAWLLDGYWTGTVSSVSWRSETFNYVDFRFVKGSSYGRGTGYERDYDENGKPVAFSNFAYEVVDGRIKLVYDNPYVVVWIDSWSVYDGNRKLDAVFNYRGNKVRMYLDKIDGWRY